MTDELNELLFEEPMTIGETAGLVTVESANEKIRAAYALALSEVDGAAERLGTFRVSYFSPCRVWEIATPLDPPADWDAVNCGDTPTAAILAAAKANPTERKNPDAR